MDTLANRGVGLGKERNVDAEKFYEGAAAQGWPCGAVCRSATLSYSLAAIGAQETAMGERFRYTELKPERKACGLRGWLSHLNLEPQTSNLSVVNLLLVVRGMHRTGMMKNVNTTEIPELSDDQIKRARERRRQEQCVRDRCCTLTALFTLLRPLLFSGALRALVELARPTSLCVYYTIASRAVPPKKGGLRSCWLCAVNLAERANGVRYCLGPTPYSVHGASAEFRSADDDGTIEKYLERIELPKNHPFAVAEADSEEVEAERKQNLEMQARRRARSGVQPSKYNHTVSCRYAALTVGRVACPTVLGCLSKFVHFQPIESCSFDAVMTVVVRAQRVVVHGQKLYNSVVKMCPTILSYAGTVKQRPRLPTQYLSMHGGLARCCWAMQILQRAP